METIFTILQSIHLSAIQVALVGICFFIAGYVWGKRKQVPLKSKVEHMEKEILELNAELLYGKPEAPVIELGKNTIPVKKAIK